MAKQYNRSLLVYAVLPVVVLVALGCNLSGTLRGDSAGIEATPTRTPMPTFTPTVELVSFSSETADSQQEVAQAEIEQQPVVEEAEVVPTEPPPPPPPSDTPTPAPANLTILQNMNIRGGPGTNYPVVGGGAPNQTLLILGRNEDGSWFKIEFPDNPGSSGWVYGPLVQVNGGTEAIEVAQAPPPPPPTPTPPPAEPPPPPPEPAKQYQFTPDGFWGTENAAIVHFKGRFRDEGGNLVNGYSVLIDNGAFRIVSHPSGASHHYPEKGDGEWDIVIPDPSSGVGWWWITVVKYDCPDFLSRFDSQCTQYTKLSEDIKILVNWPDETVVNANWTCHWDCDKGLYANAFRR
jgi:hypothetical protein